MEDREKLLEIIEDIARSRRPIDMSTCLYHDLSVSGDDAVELLERVHQTFGTTFKGFHFYKYFPDETEALSYHIASLFGFNSNKKRLSVGHLLEVIRAGQWFEEAAD